MERVVVTDLKEPNVKYFLPCSQWLAKDEGDGQICRELSATSDITTLRKSILKTLLNSLFYHINKVKIICQDIKYKITVITGNKRNAGTDSDVTIVIYGTQGDSGEWKLDDTKNNFERGQ